MANEVTDPALLAMLNGQGAAPRGNVFSLPPDPMRAAADARAAAEEKRAQDKADREAREWAATHNRDGSPKPVLTQKPVLTAKERSDAIQAYNDAFALDRVVASLRTQYQAGPEATKGLAGLQDYLPTAQNQTFDDTAQQARGFVKRSLGFTGGEGNTLGESTMLYDPYLPNTSDKDNRILNKIAALEQLAKDARAKSTAILGGVPDANGNVTPMQDDRGAPLMGLPGNGGQGGGGNPPLTPFDQSGPGGQRVATGGTKTISDPATAAALNAMFAAGASYDQINAFAQSKGANPISPSEFSAAKDYAAKRKGYQPFTATRTESTTAIERLSASPAASAGAGFANTMSMGGVQALAPEEFAASQNLNPVSGMIGSAAGAIAPTMAIGALGRNTIGRFAPSLMADTGLARFGRNLATDATYGAGYGTVTEGDPLGGAGSAVIGSALGQGVGSTLGRAVGGLSQTAPAQYLASRGVNAMTTGQRLGGFAKSLEDKAMSIPLIGDMIKNRRVDAFQDFNRAAMNEAGAPIGASTQNLGMQGVQDIIDATGTAYDNATAGVTVPLDDQFTQGMNAARARVQQLPPDLAPRGMTAINNRVGPIENMGQMSGDTYQQGVRGLKGYKAEATKPGFEADYRDSLQQAIDALTDQMKRGGGSRVVEGLDKANSAYRQAKTLEKAVTAAKNGTGSGEVQLFTPAQLNTASYQTANKFPGQRPFAQLADAGQQVLPSTIPNSGTADRLLALALPTSLGGASIGADQMGWDKAGAGLGLAALLAAGGTKSGQAALNKVLFDRPKAASAFGALVRKHKGLFGSASVPLALEVGN